MKALRAKFYCDFFKEPYEVASFVPHGRYYKLPIRMFGQTPWIASEQALSQGPIDNLQILEFYCQGVNEDKYGQYYHYFCGGL